MRRRKAALLPQPAARLRLALDQIGMNRVVFPAFSLLYWRIQVVVWEGKR